MSDERPDTAARRLAIMQHPELSYTTKFIAIRILDLQGLDRGASTKSAKWLGCDVGASEDAAKKALKQLKRWGLVKVVAGDPGKCAHRVLDLTTLDKIVALIKSAERARRPVDATELRELAHTLAGEPTRVQADPGTGVPGYKQAPTRVQADPHPGTGVPGTRVQVYPGILEPDVERHGERHGEREPAPPVAPKGPVKATPRDAPVVTYAPAEPEAEPGAPVRVVDFDSAHRRLRQLLRQAWEQLRHQHLAPAEDRYILDAARWIWKSVQADPGAFQRRAEVMVAAWADEDFVRNRLRGAPAKNFVAHIDRLFDGRSFAAGTAGTPAPLPPASPRKRSGPRTIEEMIAVSKGGTCG